jgi:hypothetical protein
LLMFIATMLTLPALVDANAAATISGRSSSAQPAFNLIAIFAIRAGLLLGLGVILPYLVTRFYLSARTAQVLDLLDGRITWLDRCPIALLGWAAYSALIAISLLLRLSQPALPAFIVVLTGAMAIMGLAAIGMLMAWGAWLCYRRDRLGWMLTFILLVGLRASAATVLWSGGDLNEITSVIGSPPAAAYWWIAPAMVTLDGLVTIAFGLFVLRYFSEKYQVAVLRTA